MAVILDDCIITNCGVGIANKGGTVKMTGGAIVGCNDAVTDNGSGVTELNSVNLSSNNRGIVEENSPIDQSTLIEASKTSGKEKNGFLKSAAELAGIFAGSAIKSQL